MLESGGAQADICLMSKSRSSAIHGHTAKPGPMRQSLTGVQRHFFFYSCPMKHWVIFLRSMTHTILNPLQERISRHQNYNSSKSIPNKTKYIRELYWVGSTLVNLDEAARQEAGASPYNLLIRCLHSQSTRASAI